MKQLYRVPFDRNSERVKHLRTEYVERVLQMDAAEIQHEFIYVDEAGSNLSKTRRRGRNVIGHRAITNVPGQRGVTSPFALLSHKMGSSTTMQTWDPIMQIRCLHFLTDCMRLSQHYTKWTRCGTLSFGTMSHFIGLLWSRTGSMITLILKFYTFPHTPPS